MRSLSMIFAAVALSGAASAEPQAPFPTQLFLDNAGRVAWHHGAGHDLIAYDSVVDPSTYHMEVFTIRPDGSGKFCVTCNAPIPKGMRGQMEWHPGGEYLVFQAENGRSQHKNYNHPSWGIDSDLWMIRKDGTGAQKIWGPDVNGGAVLHARFSRDGKLIAFAERLPTGRQMPPILRAFGPWGENQWDGWSLHFAAVDLTRSGLDVLSNHRRTQPSGTGFYETSGFTPDGKLIYSHTDNGRPYCDDIFVVNVDGRVGFNFSNSPSTWEEHGQFAPNGQHFAFISSRADKSLHFPRSKARDLTTELFMQRGDNPPVQLTRANDGGTRKVVSRFAWSPDSKRILYQVAEFKAGVQPQLWMLELP
jgi:hypothetical protein